LGSSNFEISLNIESVLLYQSISFFFDSRNTHEIHKFSETSSTHIFKNVTSLKANPPQINFTFRSSLKRKLSFWEILYNFFKVLIIIFYEAKREFLRKIYIALFLEGKFQWNLGNQIKISN
jgi:hypothetical protein